MDESFTVGDAVPFHGAPGRLLEAAIASSDYPRSLSQLARVAGISKFAASRAAAPLVESGVLHRDLDGYLFNRDHPYAQLMETVAWQLGGIISPAPIDLDTTINDLDIGSATLSFGNRIPVDLQEQPRTPSARSHPLAAKQGPDLFTVRQHLQTTERILELLRTPESLGQDVFAAWKNERLRDIVHATLDSGDALSLAQDELSAAADRDAQAGADPRTATIDAYTWVRATYLTNAEALAVRNLLERLLEAVDLGRSIRTHKRRAADRYRSAAETDNPSTRRTLITDATEEAAQAERLWHDSVGTLHHFGGTPGPDTVGDSGDQIIAAILHRALTRLVKATAAMKDSDAFTAWESTNPDAAVKHPLLTTGDLPALGTSAS